MLIVTYNKKILEPIKLTKIIIQTMLSPKSPKSQKLLQFRQKLSKLSSKKESSAHRQKLQQLQQQNIIFQSEISSIFDQISQYYLKYEEKVNSQCKEIIDAVQRKRDSLLAMLTVFKRNQMEEVRECGEEFGGFQRGVRGKLRDFQNCEHLDLFLQEISNLRPFNMRKLHSKMDDMIFNRAGLERQLQQLETLKSLINSYQKQNFVHQKHIPENSAIINQVKQIKNSQRMINQIKNSKQIRKRDEKSKKLSQLHNNLTQNESQKQESQENEVKITNLLFNAKVLDKQENLMEEEIFAQSPKMEARRQLKFLKSYEEEDEKTEKNISILKKQQKQKPMNLQRKNSQPAIGDCRIEKNLNNFLLQLKRSHMDGVNQDISSRQGVKVQHKSKVSMLTRVKSEQNMLTSKSRATPSNLELNGQNPTILSKAFDNISVINSVKVSKNTVRQSKAGTVIGTGAGTGAGTGRRGDWAQILKEQQSKYIEMRKKIKG